MPLKIPPFTPVPIQPTSAEPFSTFVQQTPLAQTPLTGSELVPIIQNGASKHVAPNTVGFGPPVRTILTANTNYYVATTGSDSNDGSLAHPWATFDHAMAVISDTLDIAGFIILVHAGAGTFAGFGLQATVGGGLIKFLGAGSGSTTISEGINDGQFNGGECFSAYFESTGTGILFTGFNWTFVSETNYALIGLFSPGLSFNFNDGGTCDHIFNLSTTTTDTVVWCSALMDVSCADGGTGHITINYSPINTTVTAETIHIEQRTLMTFAGTFIRLVGNPTFTASPTTVTSAFLFSSNSIFTGNPQFSGACSGPGVFATNVSNIVLGAGLPTTTYLVDATSTFYFVPSAPNSFGGTVGINIKAGAPTTTEIPGSGLEAVYKDTNLTAGKGLAHFANDGGIIFPLTPVRTTFANLPASPHQGDMGTISDGLAANCADGTCTTFGTNVTGGGGALNLFVWYNGTNWTLMGK